jgi:ribosomal protein S8
MFLISDMISRMCVAAKRNLKNVVVLNSKICESGLTLMKKTGYIIDFNILNFKYLSVILKYFLGMCVLRICTAISKPSFRVYVRTRRLRNMAYNNKIAINGFFFCSTSKYGLALDIECVLTGIGGELICFVG